ncbi:MAG TPA: metallophosphoesterase [Chitinispirillaceae bacterium]|nr:metallophosphoesterase [Chitinispirillaceae bacterium]
MHLSRIKKITGFFAMVTLAIGTSSADPWSFGLMGDTQWKTNLDGQNPGTVAAGIIKQLNARFIAHNVKFVVQVGDLVDSYSDANGRFSHRANACQDLYNAGIGFFPLRGNHESSRAAANELNVAFPQTTGSGSNVFGTFNFTSPMQALQGLSYSFEYNNATFVIIDQFTRKDGSNSRNDTGLVGQIDWIRNVLTSRPASTHAFLFAHKNLCGGNHSDGLFGANPSALPAIQNTFYDICASNGVRYVVGGHDHMHCRSLMVSPDRQSVLEQLICSSNSYKFYIPLVPGNDQRYNITGREIPVSQQLFTIGYYIFTIDGPRVTVDYYTSPNGCNGDCDLARTPVLTFTKNETFGYSLNGKKFIITRRESFEKVKDNIGAGDGYVGTSAEIVDGRNDITGSFYDARATVNEVTTGWTPRSEIGDFFKSDAFTLWGMQDSVGTCDAEKFVLSMSYDPSVTGPLALNVKSDGGAWVRAIDKNTGGTPKFTVGPWNPGYTLGTYGIDPSSKTVWAVINHASEFAVAPSNDGDQNNDGVIDNADILIINSLRNKTAIQAPLADIDNDGIVTVLDARKLALLKNK